MTSLISKLLKDAGPPKQGSNGDSVLLSSFEKHCRACRVVGSKPWKSGAAVFVPISDEAFRSRLSDFRLASSSSPRLCKEQLELVIAQLARQVVHYEEDDDASHPGHQEKKVCALLEALAALRDPAVTTKEHGASRQDHRASRGGSDSEASAQFINDWILPSDLTQTSPTSPVGPDYTKRRPPPLVEPDQLRPSSGTGGKELRIPYWPGTCGTHSPDNQFTRSSAGEWIDVTSQAIFDAIRVINPNDIEWQLTQDSIRTFLVSKGLTEATCEILKPGLLEEMFSESDSDRDGYISKHELKMACSLGRFRHRKHAELWVLLVKLGCSTAMARRFRPPEECISPPVQERRDLSPVRQSIYTQYERPENFPPHCGYGPVERGEYLTETLNAGMPARAAAWRCSSLRFVLLDPLAPARPCIPSCPGSYLIISTHAVGQSDVAKWGHSYSPAPTGRQ